MAEKLTKAQMRVLRQMYVLSVALVNGDEYDPPWWLEGGPPVNRKTARCLSRSPAVHFFRHEGGQPGVDYFRVSNVGRALLSSKDQSNE